MHVPIMLLMGNDFGVDPFGDKVSVGTRVCNNLSPLTFSFVVGLANRLVV